MLWARFFERELLEKPEQTIMGSMLGRGRLQENSGGCLVRSAEIPSPRQISTDKTNDCVMNYERGALVRGSDPPYGQRVHTMAGDMWRALTRRMTKKQLAAGVHQTDDKMSPSVSNGKKQASLQVWEDTVGRRRQALASETMGSPDIFEAVIYTRRSCPSPSGLVVGSSLCRD